MSVQQVANLHEKNSSLVAQIAILQATVSRLIMRIAEQQQLIEAQQTQINFQTIASNQQAMAFAQAQAQSQEKLEGQQTGSTLDQITISEQLQQIAKLQAQVSELTESIKLAHSGNEDSMKQLADTPHARATTGVGIFQQPQLAISEPEMKEKGEDTSSQPSPR